MKHTKFAFIDYSGSEYPILLLKAVSEEHVIDQVKIWKEQCGQTYAEGTVVDMRDYFCAGDISRMINDDGARAARLKLSQLTGKVSAELLEITCNIFYADEYYRYRETKSFMSEVSESVIHLNYAHYAQSKEEHKFWVNGCYSQLRQSLVLMATSLVAQRYRSIGFNFKHTNSYRLTQRLFCEYVNTFITLSNRSESELMEKLMDRERANIMLNIMKHLDIKQIYEVQEVSTFDSTKDF